MGGKNGWGRGCCFKLVCNPGTKTRGKEPAMGTAFLSGRGTEMNLACSEEGSRMRGR